MCSASGRSRLWPDWSASKGPWRSGSDGMVTRVAGEAAVWMGVTRGSETAQEGIREETWVWTSLGAGDGEGVNLGDRGGAGGEDLRSGSGSQGDVGAAP